MSFNDKTFAANYERRLSAEGYPGILVDHVDRALAGCAGLIDVGAGTGFFAIPLAERGYEVDAVEPSGYMMNILKDKIDGTISAKIRLHNSTWEEWDGEKRDAAICLHALYPMKDHRLAVEKMVRLADRRIVLVGDHEGSRKLTGLVREFAGKARKRAPFIETVRKTLGDMNMPFSEEIVEQNRTGSFYDLDEEARYYCSHLGLEEDFMDGIKDILINNTARRDGRYEFNGLYRDFMVIF